MALCMVTNVCTCCVHVAAAPFFGALADGKVMRKTLLMIALIGIISAAAFVVC